MHGEAAQVLKRRDQRRLDGDDLVAEGPGRLGADAGVEARVDDEIGVEIADLVAHGEIEGALVREDLAVDVHGLDARVARAGQGVGLRVGGDDGDDLQLRDLAEENGIQQALQLGTAAGRQYDTANHVDALLSSSRPAASRLMRSFSLRSSVRRRSSPPSFPS